jgi:sec-independent protein translocase protein TatA
MGIGIKELVVILLIVILVFGTKKIRNVGADVGGWIRDFRKAMRDDSAPADAQAKGDGKVIEGEARREEHV